MCLPVRIEFAEKEDEQGSDCNRDCQPQEQAGNQGKKGCDRFHFSSHAEPVVGFPLSHPFAERDQDAERNDNSEQQDEGKCYYVHGIFLSLILSPLVYEKWIRKEIRQTTNLLICGSDYG